MHGKKLNHHRGDLFFFKSPPWRFNFFLNRHGGDLSSPLKKLEEFKGNFAPKIDVNAVDNGVYNYF